MEASKELTLLRNRKLSSETDNDEHTTRDRQPLHILLEVEGGAAQSNKPQRETKESCTIVVRSGYHFSQLPHPGAVAREKYNECRCNSTLLSLRI